VRETLKRVATPPDARSTPLKRGDNDTGLAFCRQLKEKKFPRNWREMHAPSFTKPRINAQIRSAPLMLIELQDMSTRNWKTADLIRGHLEMGQTSRVSNSHESKTHRAEYPNRSRAFSLVELLVIVIVLLLAFGLAPIIIQKRKNAQRMQREISCIRNLKQIGTAFKIWSTDQGDLYPMEVSTNRGGTLDFVSTGLVFPHFQALSNALGQSTRVLICPLDTRLYADDFGPKFSNTNISYFLGVDARADLPAALLVGDRNITGGTRLGNGLLNLSSNSSAGWTREFHDRQGNILMADASVQQWTTPGLRQGLQVTGLATNRLGMP
jgi:hypothetical protein